jgi:Sec-independent protein secretion pathway component TatC
MAVPMLLLYETGILASKILNKKKKTEEEEEEEEEEDED